MPAADDALILHHYDASPFSQKVRRLFGIKRLAWRSVVTPNMLPKPDLVALTGGYRRAPVMQVGADIYCDSQVILAEIERRHPQPASDVGPSWPVNIWADRAWFQLSVAIIFGRLGDRVDPAFVADREALSGRPFDTAAMAAMAGPAAAQWRANAAWIERALGSGGTPFLAGAQPGIADVAAQMNVWFLASVFPDMADRLLAGFGHVARWRAALDAIGEGERSELPSDAALAVARDAAAGWVPAHDPDDPLGLAPGATVVVAADDYGRDPIAGILVAVAPERIVIRRESAFCGTLQLHFPRVGYVVGPA